MDTRETLDGALRELAVNAAWYFDDGTLNFDPFPDETPPMPGVDWPLANPPLEADGWADPMNQDGYADGDPYLQLEGESADAYWARLLPDVLESWNPDYLTFLRVDPALVRSQLARLLAAEQPMLASRLARAVIVALENQYLDDGNQGRW